MIEPELSPDYYKRREEQDKRNAYNQSVREARRKARQCVSCGYQDGRTLSGYRMCQKCALKNADYMRKYMKNYMEGRRKCFD